MPSARASRGSRPHSPADLADAAAADFPDAPSPPPLLDDDDGDHSIINAGDCRVMVSVHVYEHLPDGGIIKLPPKNPRVVVKVDVEVHLHHCQPHPR